MDDLIAKHDVGTVSRLQIGVRKIASRTDNNGTSSATAQSDSLRVGMGQQDQMQFEPHIPNQRKQYILIIGESGL